jgi:raffinose/stachyose/melibiose transport system substrate-binding protein
MKRFLTVLVMIGLAATLFASPQGETGSIVLAQNKPEIDDVLKEYAAGWAERTGNSVTIKSCGGDSCELSVQLRADYSAGEMPDIFVINGIESYREWEAIIADLSDEPWAAQTSVAFTVDGKIVGQPVAIEGWGMAYNADVLEEAGVDPSTLVNLDGYRAAFAKIESMKDSLGIDATVSMAASIGMGWVTADHNFNSLLSDGLSYGDMSVVDDLLAGDVDMQRLSEYADWVELLFQYADRAVLLTGDYDAQVGAFANGKAAFLHQGNWTDPNMAAANAGFEMAFAPHGSTAAPSDGIFVAAPTWYVVNSESENAEVAKQFLNDLVFTDEGADFIVNKAGAIPPFANIDLSPSGQLSTSVQGWAAEGKVYSWNQYSFKDDWRIQVLRPIYNQFASGNISKAEFIDLMANAFETYKDF